MAIININGKGEFQSEVDKGGVQIVKFGAPWCAPCKIVDKTLEGIEEEIDVDILKVDVDIHGEIAGEFGIMSIPTIIFVKDKKVIDKLVGSQTKEKIFEILKLVKGE